MVRRQGQKTVPGIAALEILEKETENEVKKLNDIRKAEFKNELDSAFFFSVVFPGKAERDAWLKNHDIVLEEDFFVKSKDFIA